VIPSDNHSFQKEVNPLEIPIRSPNENIQDEVEFLIKRSVPVVNLALRIV
jgi:hypothetical protein